MRRARLWPKALLVLVFVGGCPPKYPKCTGDKDCHENEFCVNGQCQECRNDGDCRGGGKCNAGRCEKAAAPSTAKECSDDAHCPAGQSCIGGVCKPCSSDAQCGDGGKCNAGRCERAGALPSPPGTCTLEPVYFDFNESALTTEATAAIDRDGACINKSNRPATLTGRTDQRGTEEYNLALSDRRAQSVKDRLVRMGISSNLKTVARGEMDATGKDEAGWAKDRRVDVSW
jgi:peptidoglycan-associated lipoprotein